MSTNGNGKNLAEWRASLQETITLPSGLGVTLRKVALLDLVAQGKIPTPLLGLIESLSNNPKLLNDFKIEDVPQFTAMLDIVVRAAVIDPPLGESADDEHLQVGELTLDDKMMIFNWGNAGTKAIAPFSGGSPAGERVGSDGGEVRTATE
jgi:hypothetical protein